MPRLVSLLLALPLLVACGEAPTAAPEPDLLPAPDGMRWVGEAGVVVAVPDWWTTGETQCGAPVEDTVYADAAATYDCPDPADPATVREVSALAVLDGTCCLGEFERRTMEPVDGRQDLVERPGCEDSLPGVCRHLFAVPDTDVVFAVTMTEDGGATWQQVRDSARTLPAGLTTVPLSVAGGSRWTPGWGEEPPTADSYARAVRQAGLRVETVVEELDDDGDHGSFVTGSLLEIDPAPGSVVEPASTVTLIVSGASLS
jgi:hypothetical protein